MTSVATAHDTLRPLMFSIAYRMLGSVAEAEDVVQEALLRMTRAEGEGTVPENIDAWATTITTRIAIDTLRSARMRRESYIGPWLPEPLVEGRAPDPAVQAETDDAVGTAMLVLMETLTPHERAAFILRETLDYDYASIATLLEQSEATCRQHVSRARRHLDAGRPRFDVSRSRTDALTEAFLDAVRGGELGALEALLAQDVTFWGDGGGRAPAIRKPMVGAVAVARFLRGLAQRFAPRHVAIDPASANGGAAVVMTDREGALLGVLTMDFDQQGRIVALRNQINPDKLRHLGAVGDLAGLVATPGSG